VRHEAAKPKPAPKKALAPVTTRPAPVTTRPVVGNPDLEGLATIPLSTVSTAVPSSSSSPRLLELGLGLALGLSLLAVCLALAPPWALPRPLLLHVYRHHDDLVFGGLAMALSLGFGILIALMAS
jgi:hypothetical protein